MPPAYPAARAIWAALAVWPAVSAASSARSLTVSAVCWVRSLTASPTRPGSEDPLLDDPLDDDDPLGNDADTADEDLPDDDADDTDTADAEPAGGEDTATEAPVENPPATSDPVDEPMAQQITPAPDAAPPPPAGAAGPGRTAARRVNSVRDRRGPIAAGRAVTAQPGNRSAQPLSNATNFSSGVTGVVACSAASVLGSWTSGSAKSR